MLLALLLFQRSLPGTCWGMTLLLLDRLAALLQEVRAYEDKFYTPLSAARHGFLDDVIDPGDTRQRLIKELRLLRNKTINRPWKKHGNIPL
jgi:propionyl-CoA carboxylase beta chain